MAPCSSAVTIMFTSVAFACLTVLVSSSRRRATMLSSAWAPAPSVTLTLARNPPRRPASSASPRSTCSRSTRAAVTGCMSDTVRRSVLSAVARFARADSSASSLPSWTSPRSWLVASRICRVSSWSTSASLRRSRSSAVSAWFINIERARREVSRRPSVNSRCCAAMNASTIAPRSAITKTATVLVWPPATRSGTAVPRYASSISGAPIAIPREG